MYQSTSGFQSKPPPPSHNLKKLVQMLQQSQQVRTTQHTKHVESNEFGYPSNKFTMLICIGPGGYPNLFCMPIQHQRHWWTSTTKEHHTRFSGNQALQARLKQQWVPKKMSKPK